jgi:hypothetical protein
MGTADGGTSGNPSGIRQPAVAGRFYESNAEALRKEVEAYCAAGKRLDSFPPILISPHAGYVFSGPVAGIGYATIDPSCPLVILIGPSHYKAFGGISIPSVASYRTPLGIVPLHQEAIAPLRHSPLVHSHADAHALEHCLEVQLPFLQVMLDRFSIVPILCGKTDAKAVADLIWPLLQDNTLVVISSDLSHYLTHAEARTLDSRSIQTVLSGNREGQIEACGETPIRIAMELAERRGLKPRLLDSRTSHETMPHPGSEQKVVGYASIAFLSDSAELSQRDRRSLLALARDALEKAVQQEPPPEPRDATESLRRDAGCFVTLKKRGQLRGCIGYIEGIKPLYLAVMDNARNAALADPRFPAVTPDELADIAIEISVLTAPEEIEYVDPNDLLSRITPMRDGLILRKGYRQSTFLPQVWEQLSDKIMFLEHLAMKAGLSRDEWRTARYQRYHAMHFEEE